MLRTPGQNIVLEANGNTDAVKAQYLRGANLVAQEIANDLFYYLFNAHGDVIQRLATGENHAPVYKYDAFGNERKPSETDPNPFRYCGEYWDNDLGELYLRNRNYDPRTGRFSREDPARSGNNWYGYCGGNPVNLADPSGLRVAGITTDFGKPVVKATPRYNAYNDYLAKKNAPKSPSRPNNPNVGPNLGGTSAPASTPPSVSTTRPGPNLGGPPTDTTSKPPAPFVNADGTSYIYGQRDNRYVSTLSYGDTLSADTGCGWVAAYNALQVKSIQVSPGNIISYFEENGGTRDFFGKAALGTYSHKVAEYLNTQDVNATFKFWDMPTPKMFDETIQDSSAVILEYIWHDTFAVGMHFVTVTYDESTDKFVVYNEFGNDTESRSYDSIQIWANTRGILVWSMVVVD